MAPDHDDQKEELRFFQLSLDMLCTASLDTGCFVRLNPIWSSDTDACIAGHNVLYTSAHDMLTQLRASRADDSLDHRMLRLVTPELLIASRDTWDQGWREDIDDNMGSGRCDGNAVDVCFSH